MNCEHEPIVEGGPNACPHCKPIPTQAPMEKVIAVGFGGATLERDGHVVVDGEQGFFFREEGKRPERIEPWSFTFGDAEELALADPDHDWRVELNGPLHGETYQRQGVGAWMLIARNDGFA